MAAPSITPIFVTLPFFGPSSFALPLGSTTPLPVLGSGIVPSMQNGPACDPEGHCADASVASAVSATATVILATNVLRMLIPLNPPASRTARGPRASQTSGVTRKHAWRANRSGSRTPRSFHWRAGTRRRDQSAVVPKSPNILVGLRARPPLPADEARPIARSRIKVHVEEYVRVSAMRTAALPSRSMRAPRCGDVFVPRTHSSALSRPASLSANL